MSEELRRRNLEPEQHTITVEVALKLHHPAREIATLVLLEEMEVLGLL